MLTTAQGICSLNQIQTRVTHGQSPTLVVLLFFINFQLISELLAKWTDTKKVGICLLYTSDAADDMQCVDLGGRRIIKKFRLG